MVLYAVLWARTQQERGGSTAAKHCALTTTRGGGIENLKQTLVDHEHLGDSVKRQPDAFMSIPHEGVRLS